MKTHNLTTVIAAFAAVSSFACALAGSTQTVAFTATVPQVLELSATQASVSIAMSSSDYASSAAITKDAAAAHSLSVRSNRPWQITAVTDASTFRFTPLNAGDTRNKPSTDLSIRKSGGTYAPLSTSSSVVASGTSGGAGMSGNTFSVDYKLATNIQLDPPGSYAINVVYIASTP